MCGVYSALFIAGMGKVQTVHMLMNCDSPHSSPSPMMVTEESCIPTTWAELYFVHPCFITFARLIVQTQS